MLGFLLHLERPRQAMIAVEEERATISQPELWNVLIKKNTLLNMLLNTNVVSL